MSALVSGLSKNLSIGLYGYINKKIPSKDSCFRSYYLYFIKSMLNTSRDDIGSISGNGILNYG